MKSQVFTDTRKVVAVSVLDVLELAEIDLTGYTIEKIGAGPLMGFDQAGTIDITLVKRTGERL